MSNFLDSKKTRIVLWIIGGIVVVLLGEFGLALLDERAHPLALIRSAETRCELDHLERVGQRAVEQCGRSRHPRERDRGPS